MKDSVILITGGTGTFGSAFLKRCIDREAREIRIFSRDERKQYDLAQKYKEYPQVKFFIGDVRDKEAVDRVVSGVNYVFHAAAMKQIPSYESYPMEAVKTNIVGSENVLKSAINHHVNKVVFLSTDKAVAPTSMMGLTKACMEKIALCAAKEQTTTEICITRFCNLIASNGSVVPLFIKQIKDGLPITITDPDMSRFMMTIKDAIDLVEFALCKGQHGDILIKSGKLCRIGDLGEAVYNFLQVKDKHLVKIIGSRPGEKRDEFLLSEMEMNKAEMVEKHIRIPLEQEKEKEDSFVIPEKVEYAKIVDIVSMLEENFNYEKGI